MVDGGRDGRRGIFVEEKRNADFLASMLSQSEGKRRSTEEEMVDGGYL